MLKESKNDSDLIMMKSMPDSCKFQKRILESKIIDRIFLFPDKKLAKDYKRLIKTIFQIYLFPKKIDPCLLILDSYSNIYIFNDINIVGWYLSIKKIKYHLIEDGFNCFKFFDQSKLRGKAKRFRHFLSKTLSMPVTLGSSSQCLDIELNDATFLKSKITCPIIEEPRSKLFEKLDIIQRQTLINIFNEQTALPKRADLLILTQPLEELGLNINRDNQPFFYKQLANKLGFFDFYVKPHPRDYSDYTKITSKQKIIQKTFPVELLNFASIHFDTALTYSSTGLESLICCDNKIACSKEIVSKSVKQYPYELKEILR